jgi:hypothetical protein
MVGPSDVHSASRSAQDHDMPCMIAIQFIDDLSKGCAVEHQTALQPGRQELRVRRCGEAQPILRYGDLLSCTQLNM